MSSQFDTIANCLRVAAQLATVSDTPRLDVELLLTHLLKKNRTFLMTWPETELTAEQSLQFQQAMARRLQGEPIAHITGVREFWSLPLQVNSSTLIPRPDTEILVETALGLSLPEDANVLDLGTGTGAIILALASEKKKWRCTGVDKSPDAVKLAQKNRDALDLRSVELLQSDWFSAVAGKQFDLILSNPPYIDPDDQHLQQGDVRFEPLSALIAPNKGLADLEWIIAQSPTYLNAQGWLLVEHGYDQAVAVQQLFSRAGFTHIRTQKDYGDNDRVTLGQKESLE